MTLFALTAGIDVGTMFPDLGCHPAGKPVRASDETGIARPVALVKQRGAARVALEAIGPYAQRLMAALTAAGVAVVNPRRVPPSAPRKGASPRPTRWTRA